MNQAYERLHSQIVGLLRHVEPKDEETIAHAFMAFMIAAPADEIHKAGERQPRVKWVDTAQRTDGWRAR